MSAPTHRQFLSSSRFTALDGLRGVIILPVLWHHAHGHSPAEGILGRAYVCLMIFFAISGFLITTLLLRERDAHGEISLSRFYVRRTLRIFPLYYTVIALYVVLVFTLEPGSDAGLEFRHNLPAFLTYSSNWFVDLGRGTRVIFYFAWSLATEEQFYLVWPFLVRFARGARAPLLIGVAVIIDQAMELAMHHGWVDGHMLEVRIITSFATPIGLGCISAYVLHARRGFDVAARLVGYRWAIPIVAALLTAAVWTDMPELVLAVGTAVLVVTVVIRSDFADEPLLAHPALRHIGKVSYGMYLTHMLVMNLVRRAVPHAGPTEIFLLTVPFSVAAGTLTFNFLERPMLSLRTRVEPWLERRRLRVVAAVAH